MDLQIYQTGLEYLLDGAAGRDTNSFDDMEENGNKMLDDLKQLGCPDLPAPVEMFLTAFCMTARMRQDAMAVWQYAEQTPPSTMEQYKTVHKMQQLRGSHGRGKDVGLGDHLGHGQQKQKKKKKKKHDKQQGKRHGWKRHGSNDRRCWTCNSPNHFERQCTGSGYSSSEESSSDSDTDHGRGRKGRHDRSHSSGRSRRGAGDAAGGTSRGKGISAGQCARCLHPNHDAASCLAPAPLPDGSMMARTTLDYGHAAAARGYVPSEHDDGSVIYDHRSA